LCRESTQNTFPPARRVSSGGVVYANDISASILDVVKERARREGVENIKIVVGAVEDPLFVKLTIHRLFGG